MLRDVRKIIFSYIDNIELFYKCTTQSVAQAMKLLVPDHIQSCILNYIFGNHYIDICENILKTFNKENNVNYILTYPTNITWIDNYTNLHYFPIKDYLDIQIVFSNGIIISPIWHGIYF